MYTTHTFSKPSAKLMRGMVRQLSWKRLRPTELPRKRNTLSNLLSCLCYVVHFKFPAIVSSYPGWDRLLPRQLSLSHPRLCNQPLTTVSNTSKAHWFTSWPLVVSSDLSLCLMSTCLFIFPRNSAMQHCVSSLYHSFCSNFTNDNWEV